MARPPDLPQEPKVLVRGLGKRFKHYRSPWHRALDWALPGGRRYEELWALRGVDLEVEDGRCLGVIGNNGSGKSTLLKLLTGTLHPTEGSAAVSGRLFSILELNSGFLPELTGRENLRHAGQLLALPRGYVEERQRDIEAFSELGDFLERPFKTYSSGMQIRLAFSLYAFLEPEVLLLDEALAVGDVFFQQKSYGRVRDLLRSGVTAVFVSHDMAAVRNLCDDVVLLDEGRITFRGEPAEAVSRYYSSVGRRRQGGAPVFPRVPPTHQPLLGSREPLDPVAIRRGGLTAGLRKAQGGGAMEIVGARVVDDGGRERLTVQTGETVRVQLLVRALEQTTEPSAGLIVYDRLGNLVFASGTRQARSPLPVLGPGEEAAVEIAVRVELGPGAYPFHVGCSEPVDDPNPNLAALQWLSEGLGPLVVEEGPDPLPGFYGLTRLPCTVRSERVPPPPDGPPEGKIC